MQRGVLIGSVLFVIGLVCVAVDVLPFFLGDRDTPLWLNLACLLAPVGFVVAVWAALRAGRAEQRAAVTELAARAPDTLSSPNSTEKGT